MINKMEQPQQEISEAVKNAFNSLHKRMGERDLIFKNQSGEQRFNAIKNPAGNIAIHSYYTGHDYLLWEDGKIEALDTGNPDNTVDGLTAQDLNSIISEIEELEEEEIEYPE